MMKLTCNSGQEISGRQTIGRHFRARIVNASSILISGFFLSSAPEGQLLYFELLSGVYSRRIFCPAFWLLPAIYFSFWLNIIGQNPKEESSLRLTSKQNKNSYQRKRLQKA